MFISNFKEKTNLYCFKPNSPDLSINWPWMPFRYPKFALSVFVDKSENTLPSPLDEISIFGMKTEPFSSISDLKVSICSEGTPIFLKRWENNHH
ncbi:MAG: hypothetical protein ACJZ8A_03510 [Paracoccaceae bacterium]